MEDLLASPVVVTALIALAGTLVSVVVSAVVSWRVSRREVKKLKLTWMHDGEVLSETEFKDMAGAVSSFIGCGWSKERRTALEKVARVRAKATGSMVGFLDDLHSSLTSANIARTEESLKNVLEQKRRQDGNSADK